MRTTFRLATLSMALVLATSMAQAGERKLKPYTPGFNGVTAPTVIAESAVDVAVPEAALAEVQGATLTVSAVVRKDGSVAEVQVVDCSAQGLGLESAAAEAVSRWRFEPGQWRGMPVDTVKTMKIYLGDAKPEAVLSSALPGASGQGMGRFDPDAPVLRIPGARSTEGGMPTDSDPQYNKPTVVAKPPCAERGCLYEKAPGASHGGKLVSLPTVPVESGAGGR